MLRGVHRLSLPLRGRGARFLQSFTSGFVFRGGSQIHSSAPPPTSVPSLALAINPEFPDPSFHSQSQLHLSDSQHHYNSAVHFKGTQYFNSLSFSHRANDGS